MSFNNTTSLYDILDLKPDASPQEIREAYLRTKSAYNKDSVALYTLITPEERESTLARIQEAYDILSSEEKRRDYDRNHGYLDLDRDIEEPVRVPLNKKIISIDRVPPMENSANSEAMLVAPTTDFTTPGTEPVPPPMNAIPANVTPLPEREVPTPPVAPAAAAKPTDSGLNQEIAKETEWHGHFLRRIREIRRISLEELSGITKVSKTYLQAIEEENFARLPAPVFLRGFVTQVAKTLKLPHEQVVAAYMTRVQQARTEKPAK